MKTSNDLMREWYSNNTPLEIAKRMKINPNELSKFVERFTPFLVVAYSEKLNERLSDKKFLKDKTPIEMLYEGRDIFIDVMDSLREENEIRNHTTIDLEK